MTSTPRPRPPLATGVGIALAGAGLFIAGVVAVWGLLSLGLDRDVIAADAVAPALVPLATGVTAIVVAAVLLAFIARRWPAHSASTRIGYGAVVGVLALLTWLIALTLGHFLGGATPSAAADFAIHQLVQPFAWALAAVAMVVGAAALAAVGFYDPDKPAPRWHWETHEEDD